MSGIKPGDRVRFVNENMEGVVTKIQGNTAGVTIEDDFEIPVLLSEIVKINEPVSLENEPKQSLPKPKFVKVHSGIHIAFERINEHILELKLHNSESDQLFFAYYTKAKEDYDLVKTGRIELEETISLGRYDLETFSTWPVLAFQFMLINTPARSIPGQVVKTIKFSAKEFHGAFGQCYFLGKQAYTFRLDERIPNTSLEKLKTKDFNEPASSPAPAAIDLNKKPAEVIDLHIEKLTSYYHDMQPQQMLDLQMEVFGRSLEMAHIHKMKKLVFIHGIGNHFLKNKIKNYLSKQKTMVHEFRDADLLKYGGGATEVFLN